MILSLFAITFIIFLFSSFFVAFQINGLNRAIINTPVSLIENCAFVSEDSQVLIDNEMVLEKLTYYYDNTIRQYVPNYEIEIFYYNNDDFSFCIDDFCSGIEVKVDAVLMYGYKFSRVMYYEVTKA